ncbi:hypothetical protein EYF80_007742 [Liparis tanakae]|uniref:Uncharacterized protein n=1 Tax=Liparis tanakae TaxID=230148 RepID=A0A4Z2IW32_9TELE|nr:hypothetical protein EYF80_007742 [Liparis tanakae]
MALYTPSEGEVYHQCFLCGPEAYCNTTIGLHRFTRPLRVSCSPSLTLSPLRLPALALHADLGPQRGDLQLVLLGLVAEVLQLDPPAAQLLLQRGDVVLPLRRRLLRRLLEQEHLLLSDAQLLLGLGQLALLLLLQAVHLLLHRTQLGCGERRRRTIGQNLTLRRVMMPILDLSREGFSLMGTSQTLVLQLIWWRGVEERSGGEEWRRGVEERGEERELVEALLVFVGGLSGIVQLQQQLQYLGPQLLQLLLLGQRLLAILLHQLPLFPLFLLSSVVVHLLFLVVLLQHASLLGGDVVVHGGAALCFQIARVVWGKK